MRILVYLTISAGERLPTSRRDAGTDWERLQSEYSIEKLAIEFFAVLRREISTATIACKRVVRTNCAKSHCRKRCERKFSALFDPSVFFNRIGPKQPFNV